MISFDAGGGSEPSVEGLGGGNAPPFPSSAARQPQCLSGGGGGGEWAYRCSRKEDDFFLPWSSLFNSLVCCGNGFAGQGAWGLELVSCERGQSATWSTLFTPTSYLIRAVIMTSHWPERM
jgi:hypothetical protein